MKLASEKPYTQLLNVCARTRSKHIMNWEFRYNPHVDRVEFQVWVFLLLGHCVQMVPRWGCAELVGRWWLSSSPLSWVVFPLLSRVSFDVESGVEKGDHRRRR